MIEPTHTFTNRIYSMNNKFIGTVITHAPMFNGNEISDAIGTPFEDAPGYPQDHRGTFRFESIDQADGSIVASGTYLLESRPKGSLLTPNVEKGEWINFLSDWEIETALNQEACSGCNGFDKGGYESEEEWLELMDAKEAAKRGPNYNPLTVQLKVFDRLAYRPDPCEPSEVEYAAKDIKFVEHTRVVTVQHEDQVPDAAFSLLVEYAQQKNMDVKDVGLCEVQTYAEQGTSEWWGMLTKKRIEDVHCFHYDSQRFGCNISPVCPSSLERIATSTSTIASRTMKYAEKTTPLLDVDSLSKDEAAILMRQLESKLAGDIIDVTPEYATIK